MAAISMSGEGRLAVEKRKLLEAEMELRDKKATGERPPSFAIRACKRHTRGRISFGLDCYYDYEVNTSHTYV